MENFAFVGDRPEYRPPRLRKRGCEDEFARKEVDWLFRRHANGAVEPDDFAIQHFVVEDVPNERRVFGRTAKPRWERHLLRQRFACRLRETGKQGSIDG